MQENEMLSRALSLATAMLLIGFATSPAFLSVPAAAQNLEAGKSPAQLFSANCSVCHKSARGLLKSVPPGQLPGFLRQHYTTSSDMAQSMSSYVIANGAGGGRRPNEDNLTRQGRELSREQPATPGDAAAAPGRGPRPAIERAPGPDAAPEAEPGTRPGRQARRGSIEAAPDAARPGERAATEADRPAAAKQRPGKKNRRQRGEPSKTDP